ncbi:hypothetical protein CCM_04853 [Cordyceps militaris CM01]|uniref:Uncharacterized protein n=2 Tax=Cordyceps militaris TaxID=73501 RepID=G3JEY6_CORMM|nr:uncharacterized protein CCM_04853 [Cordyceps militaris CM01]ATY63825.1 hypothetical protein A9K55_003963 [Cordyceps militaris]EGX93479.1 hypothetical protein CCM_04853 [Cordyceps militaris CM01]
MADIPISQLKLELTAAENRRAELKQEFFGVHAALREKKAAMDRLKCTHDPSSNTNKYAQSLQLEGDIAELQQKEVMVTNDIHDTMNSIMLLKYRIESRQ